MQICSRMQIVSMWKQIDYVCKIPCRWVGGGSGEGVESFLTGSLVTIILGSFATNIVVLVLSG